VIGYLFAFCLGSAFGAFAMAFCIASADAYRERRWRS